MDSAWGGTRRSSSFLRKSTVSKARSGGTTALANPLPGASVPSARLPIASGYAQPEGDVGRAAPGGRSMLGGITRAGFPATTLSGGTSDRMTAP